MGEKILSAYSLIYIDENVSTSIKCIDLFKRYIDETNDRCAKDKNILFYDNETIIKEFDSLEQWKSFNFDLSKKLLKHQIVHNKTKVDFVVAKVDFIEPITEKNINRLMIEVKKEKDHYTSEYGTLGLEITENKPRVSSAIENKSSKTSNIKREKQIIVYIKAEENSFNINQRNKSISSKSIEFFNNLKSKLRQLGFIEYFNIGNIGVYTGTLSKDVNIRTLKEILIDKKLREHGFNVGACIYKESYPLQSAFNIAKECCLNSKVKSNGKNLFIDFHIARGNDISSIDSIRNRNYILDNKVLTERPYSLTDETNGLNSLYKLVDIFESNNISKSDLKTLRNNILISNTDANETIEIINNKIKNNNRLLKINDGETLGRYIDALEIYDIEDIKDKEKI